MHLVNTPAPRLSVCMIVRNEQRLLPRCIASLKGAFDELCIVDTGSTDGTIQLAQELGGKLRSFDACNFPDGSIRDFSLARNAALEMASGDWILSIDADEVLADGAVEALAHSLRTTTASGLQVLLRDDGEQWRTARLFRNIAAHRFVGRVHEYVPIRGAIEDALGVTLDHFPDKRGKESSNDRNLRLCEAEVRDNPADYRALYYLGNELRNAQRYDEAILRYTQQLALGMGWPSERYQACLGIALCHFANREFLGCVHAGLRALVIDPRYAEAHCLVADAYKELGNLEFARQWYGSAIACGSPPANSPTMTRAVAYAEYPTAQRAECEQQLSLAQGRNLRGQV